MFQIDVTIKYDIFNDSFTQLFGSLVSQLTQHVPADDACSNEENLDFLHKHTSYFEDKFKDTCVHWGENRACQRRLTSTTPGKGDTNLIVKASKQ